LKFVDKEISVFTMRALRFQSKNALFKNVSFFKIFHGKSFFQKRTPEKPTGIEITKN